MKKDSILKYKVECNKDYQTQTLSGEGKVQFLKVLQIC